MFNNKLISIHTASPSSLFRSCLLSAMGTPSHQIRDIHEVPMISEFSEWLFCNQEVMKAINCLHNWKRFSFDDALVKLSCRKRSTKKCKTLMTLNSQRLFNVFRRNLIYNEASVNKQTSGSGFGWARVTVFAIIPLSSWKHWLCSSVQRSPIASFWPLTASSILLRFEKASLIIEAWRPLQHSYAWIPLSWNRIPASQIFPPEHVISREHRSVF
jgi:hypothetical protein